MLKNKVLGFLIPSTLGHELTNHPSYSLNTFVFQTEWHLSISNTQARTDETECVRLHCSLNSCSLNLNLVQTSCLHRHCSFNMPRLSCNMSFMPKHPAPISLNHLWPRQQNNKLYLRLRTRLCQRRPNKMDVAAQFHLVVFFRPHVAVGRMKAAVLCFLTSRIICSSKVLKISVLQSAASKLHLSWKHINI